MLEQAKSADCDKEFAGSLSWKIDFLLNSENNGMIVPLSLKASLKMAKRHL